MNKWLARLKNLRQRYLQEVILIEIYKNTIYQSWMARFTLLIIK